jgi:hypothetical protein
MKFVRSMAFQNSMQPRMLSRAREEPIPEYEGPLSGTGKQNSENRIRNFQRISHFGLGVHKAKAPSS